MIYVAGVIVGFVALHYLGIYLWIARLGGGWTQSGWDLLWPFRRD